jgi:SpoVK/Ycf46/Vps4 family AAA+-type ATPase
MPGKTRKRKNQEFEVAKFELIKKLIKAHIEEDNPTFRQAAIQIAANEASIGHAVIAKEIRELIEQLQPSMAQRTGRVPPKILASNRNSKVEELLHATFPRERLSDMVLAEKTQKSIEQIIIEWQNFQLIESHGLKCLSKILLIGPPGCGKSMCARVIAGELGMPLFIVKLESVISRFLGETSVHLRNIFDAMTTTQGVYLFDEFDSIGTTRSDQRDIGEVRRILSNFLLYMEELIGNSLLIAATNYEHALDTALFRRFDDVIYFPMPDIEKSQLLLKLKLRSFPTNSIDLASAAANTDGMSYAEITKATVEAIKTTILKKHKKLSHHTLIEAIQHRKLMKPILENRK